jgi:tRNA modification GTPase
MPFARHDTIVALATAPGTAAIAVVRLSGRSALAIARELTGLEPRPRFAELCTFRDGAGAQLDRGLLLFFPGPRSYTGEDVVELHCHGGRISTDRLLAEAFRRGARAAEPGEFTLRAFLNDKIDLLQAEAVADLIESGSEQAARAALRSLEGEFSRAVGALQNGVTRLRVKIEASLDFPDEDLPLAARQQYAAELDTLLVELGAMTSAAEQGAVLREGIIVTIAGPPNAGKSSLLNRLAGYDAAIVTDVPGTTRDPLKEHVTLDGAPVSIIDTAGLRESNDLVEKEGLRRARIEIGRADHVLWVGDATAPLDADLRSATSALGAATAFTLIRNKIDLAGEPAGRTAHGNQTVIALSALTGEGVHVLRAHLRALAGPAAEIAGAFGARRRHIAALARAERHFQAARSFLGTGPELAAEELRAAQAALSELTGELTSDDLLGEIFSTFCIGK